MKVSTAQTGVFGLPIQSLWVSAPKLVMRFHLGSGRTGRLVGMGKGGAAITPATPPSACEGEGREGRGTPALAEAAAAAAFAFAAAASAAACRSSSPGSFTPATDQVVPVRSR